MARRRFLAALIMAAGSGVVAGLLRGPEGLRVGLLCLACGIGGSLLLLLAPPPWPPRRRAWRVRYHAPELAGLDALRLGQGLTLLARYAGWVDLVWQRRAGMLTLTVESAATVDLLLPNLLTQLLPEATVEPTTAPERVGGGMSGRWSLAGDAAGVVPLVAAPRLLLGDTLLVGDREVRWHLAGGGGVVLVQGTLAPGADARGLRRWRGPARWKRWLFRHYRLWDPWPGGGSLWIDFPTTGGRSGAALDSQHGQVMPLPPTYQPASDAGPRLCLGIATADGQPVEIRAAPEAGVAGTAWRGHFGLLGTSAETAATVRALIAAARRAGVSVVRLRVHAPPADERPSPAGTIYPIDLDNPGVSLHWNLLTAATPRTPAPEDVLRALRGALRDQVPLLGTMLAQMGLVSRSSEAGWSLLLDTAQIVTIRYYRTGLAGGDRAVGPPSLRTVYDLLADPPALLALAAAEAAVWRSLDGGVSTTVNTLHARLAARPQATHRQVAAGLCDRLAPLVCYPRLAPWWAAPLTAPGAVLDHPPGVLVDGRLPAGEDERAAQATHRYGIYLLTCLIALAQARRAIGVTSPPVLLVLEEGSAWWQGALLTDHLATLAAAGIAVLTTTTRLPADPVGARLLAGAATWWIQTLDPVDQARLRPHLHAWGVPPDHLLARPPGIALLKLPGGAGPVVVTVRPPLTEEVA